MKAIEEPSEKLEVNPHWATNTIVFRNIAPNPIVIDRTLLIGLNLIRQTVLPNAKALLIDIPNHRNDRIYSVAISANKLNEVCQDMPIISERNQQYVIERFIQCSNYNYNEEILRGKVEHELPEVSTIEIKQDPFTVIDQNGTLYYAHDLFNYYKHTITLSILEQKAFMISLRQVHHPDLPIIKILCFPEWLPKKTPKLSKTLKIDTEESVGRNDFLHTLKVWGPFIVPCLFASMILFIHILPELPYLYENP